MTPGFWLVLLLSCIVIASGGGIVGYRIASGEAEVAALKVEGARAAERAAHAQQLAAANEKVLATEKQWQANVGDIAAIHQQELTDAQTKINDLHAAVHAGAVRLSIAVKPDPTAAGNCAAGGNPSPAPGPVAETRAELVPEAADALIDIAADGDDAVRAFNACHDSYEALRLKKAAP